MLARFLRNLTEVSMTIITMKYTAENKPRKAEEISMCKRHTYHQNMRLDMYHQKTKRRVKEKRQRTSLNIVSLIIRFAISLTKTFLNMPRL
jgi:hypothetical protein